MITAFVMIKTEGPRTTEVARRIAEIEGVTEVYFPVVYQE